MIPARIFEVIGVVRHSKHYNLNSVGREQVYMAYRQESPGTMYLALRTAGDPLDLTASVRNEVWAIDPDQPISDVRSMEQRVSGAVSQPQFNLVLLGTFAAMRTHELGIRMALGATQREVRTLVVRQGMALVAGGAAIGLGAALALSRVLRGAVARGCGGTGVIHSRGPGHADPADRGAAERIARLASAA